MCEDSHWGLSWSFEVRTPKRPASVLWNFENSLKFLVVVGTGNPKMSRIFSLLNVLHIWYQFWWFVNFVTKKDWFPYFRAQNLKRGSPCEPQKSSEVRPILLFLSPGYLCQGIFCDANMVSLWKMILTHHAIFAGLGDRKTLTFTWVWRWSYPVLTRPPCQHLMCPLPLSGSWDFILAVQYPLAVTDTELSKPRRTPERIWAKLSPCILESHELNLERNTLDQNHGVVFDLSVPIHAIWEHRICFVSLQSSAFRPFSTHKALTPTNVTVVFVN